MKLGDIVTVIIGAKHGRPHVVVREPYGDQIKICYCGTGRWYVPELVRVDRVGSVRDDLYGSEVRRCRRLLIAARANPRPDGWIRIQAGPAYNNQDVVVGHVDIPWSWQDKP